MRPDCEDQEGEPDGLTEPGSWPQGATFDPPPRMNSRHQLNFAGSLATIAFASGSPIISMC